MSREQSDSSLTVLPGPVVVQCRSYVIPPRPKFIDLPLGNTERVIVSEEEAETLNSILSKFDVSSIVGYPNSSELQQLLAERLEVLPDRVLVTAGADEALERALESVLGPGRELIVTSPTFEMIPVYARLAGGNVRQIPWLDGAYPVDGVLEAVGADTAVIAVVTPNNPTGAVVSRADIQRIALAVPHILILVDMAYSEFADVNLTADLLNYPNVVMVRSLSKAWGMPGLRVGYAVGDARVIAWMSRAGGPYTISGLSLSIAEERIRQGEESIRVYVQRVRAERSMLTTLISELGGRPLPSQANFVLARFENARWVRDGLAGLGIGSRSFSDNEALKDTLRISCPGDQSAFVRLEHAFKAVLNPEAILFDLDGVLADVSASYRMSIIETAKSFGVSITVDDISAIKAHGNANNDWQVTQRLLLDHGLAVSLAEVIGRFESLYQGTETEPGLRATETLLVERPWLESLGRRYSLAVVTGRPRRDAERFLHDNGIRDLFEALVCMEDAELKPSPMPVRLALERLGVTRAWMLGDTPDDLVAARAAGVMPVGVAPPGELLESAKTTLIEAGAACVLEKTEQLMEKLK
jgi:histidinol-phosphate aminotransferase